MEEVRRQLRLVVDVHGREVVLFAIRDTFYALDRKCYRESKRDREEREKSERQKESELPL